MSASSSPDVPAWARATFEQRAALARLGEEIADLAVHLTAATARLLTLIRAFDAGVGWEGFASCAHWLSWRVGLDLGAAREHVRVARALGRLPLLAEALEKGELSYAKVRALTRVATPETQPQLLAVAQQGTAAHVERIVRGWRHVDRRVELLEEGRHHARRTLQVYHDDDGSVVIRGRVAPEVGALLLRALEGAKEALYERARGQAATPSPCPYMLAGRGRGRQPRSRGSSGEGRTLPTPRGSGGDRPARRDERRKGSIGGGPARTDIRRSGRSRSEPRTGPERGRAMRYYVGVDCADREHAVWVEDEHGTGVWSGRVAHTVEAFAEWGRWLEERRAQGDEVWAALERPDGRVVEFLLDHGVVVYPLNPKAVARARDRFRPTGGKDDPFDARVQAGFLRTDHQHLAPLRPSSEAAQELKELTRDYARQVRQQTRLLNQLTITLKEYYPQALEICDDLKSRWGQAFLRAYPTPAALQPLTERQWRRWARHHRLTAKTIDAGWAAIQRPALAVPAHVVRSKARRLGVLLEQLTVTAAAVKAYQQAVEAVFAQLPAAQYASTLPGGGSGTTLPSVWAELGDAPGRWETAQQLQGHAGSVPVTARSGKGHVVLLRRACNRHLRAAIHQLAFNSLRHSEWARAYYERCRQRGHKHQRAVRGLAAKWLKIIFVMWTRQVPYDEQLHLANIARHHLRQPA
jgi:hypothetical protein